MKILIWPTLALLLCSPLAWAANPSQPTYTQIEAFIYLKDGTKLSLNLTFDVSSRRIIRNDSQCATLDQRLVPCDLTYALIDQMFTIHLRFEPGNEPQLESLGVELSGRIRIVQNGEPYRRFNNGNETLVHFRSPLTEAEANAPPYWLIPRATTTSVSPQIHRWIFEYQGTMMLIEVLETDGGAVLTQFAKHQAPLQFEGGPLRARDLNLRAVRKFSIVEPKPHSKHRGFKLEFDPRRTLLNNKRTLKSKLMVPVSLTLYPGDTVMIIEGRFASTVTCVLRWQGSYWKRPYQEASFTSKIPNARLVLEPETAAPVSYDDYFLPKQIQLPRDFPRRWPSQTWSEVIGGETWKRAAAPEIVKISAASDLILGGRLKDREAEVFALLQKIDKPTIAEFLAVIGGPPKVGEVNPFAFYGDPGFAPILEAAMPKLISLFEHAFPRAHFFGLGRDIYLLNDILDAYYTSLGQTGRVTRLPASAPSFYDSTPELVAEFLQTFAFALPSRGVQYAAPNVIFDVTSYHNSSGHYSQSRHLMRAVYTQIEKLGLNPHDFLRQVNFISTGSSGNNVRPVDSPLAIQKYFAGAEADSEGPKTIMQIYNDRRLQYTNAWHDIYGRFKRDADGRVIAPPGRAASPHTKLNMLSDLWVITQTVMSEGFHQLVRQEMPALCPDALAEAPPPAP